MLSTVPCHSSSGIGVHRHRDRLPGPHIRQLRLLGIRIDPDMVGGDEVEGGGRGLQVLARRDRGHVRHDAGEGRPDDGVVELALRLVDLRLGLQILRMFCHRNIRISGQSCELNLRLLLQRGDLALVGLKCEARLVVVGLGVASDFTRSPSDRRWPDRARPEPVARRCRSACGDSPASSIRSSAPSARGWPSRSRRRSGIGGDRAGTEPVRF